MKATTTVCLALALAFGLMRAAQGAVWYTARISQATFAGAWPFTVPAGTIACERLRVAGLSPLGIVTFTANGTTYALNGLAGDRASKHGWKDVHEIWRDDPALRDYHVKVSIGDVIEKGLALCAGP